MNDFDSFSLSIFVLYRFSVDYRVFLDPAFSGKTSDQPSDHCDNFQELFFAFNGKWFTKKTSNY